MKKKVSDIGLIEKAIRDAEGNMIKASKILGITPRTLFNYFNSEPHLRQVQQEYKDKRTRSRPRTTIKDVEMALKIGGGFISRAADILCISQAAVSQRIKKYPHLQQIRAEIDRSYLDLGITKLIENVQKGDYNSIRFLLRCKGKDDGWIEESRLELTTPKDTIWKVERVIVEPDRNTEDKD